MKKNAIVLLAMALFSTSAAVVPATTTEAKSVSSSYKVEVSTDSDSDATLYNASGDQTSNTVSDSSKWSVSNISNINGKDYYKVSSDGYISSDDSFLYKKRPEVIKVATDHEVSVYNHKFEESTKVKLEAGSKWYSDSSIYTSAGMPFLRVAPDTYVAMFDVVEQSFTSSVN
ncbi:SLAP domain-containing protein [Companilactobacillus allii]|uniref:S-layer protein C-terminal domain-containing protein n=1 Tax=Companilactobacillus allii TaxID=1847728 RepID=A0A1P8Q2N5_9LACO|nr:SLAP domain-containing protein [Companilactobacillus allii]APX72118.1 hypothetical protein BTM29_05885 [Companilactobacillus allii]USQ69213.1 SLAP domain-containing protein [Companilactobacillus allii]